LTRPDTLALAHSIAFSQDSHNPGKIVTNPEQKLLAAIKTRRDDLVALCQDLIRIPTLNPPGRHYLDICEYLGQRLKRQGFAIELIRAHGTPGDSDKYPRWNMIARHQGSGGGGECVHFNSHHDVVEVGNGWNFDPFAATLKDGRIYGRGACDMKGGLAASVIAAEAFIETFPEYHGRVEISATADEETGGFGGVAYLAEQGHFHPDRVQHVIIPEPLNKDRICLAIAVSGGPEIETKGRIAHGSMPFLGDCAIRHMGALIAEMESSLFPLLAAKRTKMPVVPEGAKQSTLNINSIHGGEAEPESGYTGLPAPCVPDRCRMIIDRRYLIEEDPHEVKAEVIAMLDHLRNTRPDFDYEIRDLHQVIPSMTRQDAPVVATVARAITKVLGRGPEYVVSPGTYDQKHIDRIGRLKNCIAYGPGILDLAHQPDEWVGVDDMLDSARVMALALQELLTRPA